jgi:hypothetical protein
MDNQIYKVVGDKYVAAVIQGTYQLSLWLMGVPRSRLDTLKVHSMTGRESYPFDLIEFKMDKTVTFVEADIEDVDDMCKTLRGSGASVLAVYRITKDFQGDPKNPGADYMGALDHVHLE